MASLPLAGIRVLDFCWVGAGSYMTRLLADHGADVIKVETRTRVDPVRTSPPYADGVPGVNRSGYFTDRNSSKRSLTLNMKVSRARELARELVRHCDIVSNNFTPGVMDRFGLGYDQVHALNPAAIYIAMSMQGDSGPERDYLGFGLTISALVGLHHLTALPGREPAGTGTNYPDHVPNPAHAAFAVLAALRHRRRTGQGQYIDMAQTEPTIALLAPAILDYTVNGNDQSPAGNQSPSRAPHGVYRCRGDDQWIALAVRTDGQWRAASEVLGLQPGAQEPDWSTADGRHADRDRLDDAVAAAAAGHDAETLAGQLIARGVPAAPVRTADRVIADPQLAHREHFQLLRHPEMGERIYNRPPFRFSAADNSLTRPAPLLGQHTAEICRELLGMDETQVDDLRRDGVLS
jgi:benzylsuccinate CoA-transferase BbsF subunit